MESEQALKVDCYFVFEYAKLFSTTNDKKTGRKAGDIKRLDVDNRLKPCLDELSKILEIDDKYFFAGRREKLWSKSLENANQVIIRIAPYKPREITELECLSLE